MCVCAAPITDCPMMALCVAQTSSVLTALAENYMME